MLLNRLLIFTFNLGHGLKPVRAAWRGAGRSLHALVREKIADADTANDNAQPRETWLPRRQDQNDSGDGATTSEGILDDDELETILATENITVRFKQPFICETTPGVNSYSGYVDLDERSHTFFWFFEARSQPEEKPITLWLNGGPGSDSLIGLLTEIGPCQINPDMTTKLNPFSWTEETNLLVLSQPLGVGFSYESRTEATFNGDGPYLLPYVNATSVDRSDLAAIATWHVVQEFLKKLPRITNRIKSKAFHLWTESYGGHYGPVFFRYFYDQNKLIRKGEIEGVELDLKTLGIGNGIVDAEVQFPYYPNFASNNTYGIEALPDKWIDYMSTACYMLNGCLDQVWRCRQSVASDPHSIRTTAICVEAAHMCRDNVEGPYYLYSDRNMYDIRRQSYEQAYPDFFITWLNLPETQRALGVQVSFLYEESSHDVYSAFQQTGDYVYPGFRDDLEFLLEAGIRVLLIYGDADYIGNWLGGEAVSLALRYRQSSVFAATAYEPLTVDLETHGKVREFGNLSFAVIHDAGHFVPAEKPDVALELFRRAIGGRSLATGGLQGFDGPLPFQPDPPFEGDLDAGFGSGEDEADGEQADEEDRVEGDAESEEDGTERDDGLTDGVDEDDERDGFIQASE